MRRGLAGAFAALSLAACAEAPAILPQAPVPAGPGVVVKAEPVPLNAADPTQDRVGAFAYAGGLNLTSDQTSRLHGLSDLKIGTDGRLVSEGDEGDLLRARLVLDAGGRPIGLADATLSPLTGLDGQPLQGKAESDAEGVAVAPNGDLLVSFERHHRIWLYPAAGGPPRAVPMPGEAFPDNDGMEALAMLPAAGPDAYVVGAEDTGHTWVCRISGGCRAGYTVEVPQGFGLVAAAPLDGGRIAWLLRDWNPLTGNHVILRILDAQGGEIDRMTLARPQTVDNFEGLAALLRPNGSIRFYMISDDNFTTTERTLLLAFDWTPKP
ncbi:esterase-like activity of phytase family protein [Phenylobacterium sp.]|jgi:hypothetical protein|uniref:esterase-like activity of phytase family protein n=1 Tax=Phenylobacterium sp. TaxID=1871053 RepID=UPI002F41C547